MKRSQLSFPAVPTDLPAKTRTILTSLEQGLTNNWSRALVSVEEEHDLDLFFLFVDHLLYFTACKRILLLVSAASKSELVQTWKKRSSSVDGQLLAERYRTAYTSTLLSAQEYRVCISTPREIQIHLRQDASFSSMFDVVLFYNVPSPLSPVWQTIIEGLSAYLIGFCRRPTAETVAFFHGNVVSAGDTTSWLDTD